MVVDSKKSPVKNENECELIEKGRAAKGEGAIEKWGSFGLFDAKGQHHFMWPVLGVCTEDGALGAPPDPPSSQWRSDPGCGPWGHGLISTSRRTLAAV